VQAVEVEREAAAAQAVPLGGAHDRVGVDAVAPADPGGLADLVERHVAAEVAEHHGQAGGAAVGGLQLLDERHLVAAAGAGELLERREQLGGGRRRGLGRGRSRLRGGRRSDLGGLLSARHG
jgi:hypothetical protein